MRLSSHLLRLFVRNQAATVLLDLRSITDDLFAAAEIAGSSRFLIQVPLSRCRSRMGFPYTSNSPHPVIRTARAYLEGRISSYHGSPLEEYFHYHQPSNAAERLALSGTPSADLMAASPYGIVLPWQRVSPAEAQRRSMQIKKRERKRHLAKLRVREFLSDKTERNRILEFARITALADSIRRNGYKRTNERDGDITAKLLIRPGEGVRYILASGKHRAAVLAALHVEYIPIRLRFHPGPSVERVADWPQVRSGLYTREQAVQFFNRIWDGEPPPRAVPAAWRG
jgi:hypothetical protein